MFWPILANIIWEWDTWYNQGWIQGWPGGETASPPGRFENVFSWSKSAFAPGEGNSVWIQHWIPCGPKFTEWFYNWLCKIQKEKKINYLDTKFLLWRDAQLRKKLVFKINYWYFKCIFHTFQCWKFSRLCNLIPHF